MQTKAIIALLVAAVGVSAAPAVEGGLALRQDATIPIEIFDSAGCNNGPTPASTANIASDGSCTPISAILTANTDSGIVNDSTVVLKPGCIITLFSDSTCSSTNILTITASGQCRTFGTGKFIGSARTNGPGNCI